MAEQFSNRAQTTLNGGISNVTETIVVTSASAFPATGNFRILIDSEIILVTSVAGNTFTCTAGRGAESTTAAAHSNGATVTHVLTAGALDTGIDDRVEDHRAGALHDNIPLHYHNDELTDSGGGLFSIVAEAWYWSDSTTPDVSIAADQNNYSPGGSTIWSQNVVFNLTATVAVNITGLADPGSDTYFKIFRNVGTNNITLKHQSGLSIDQHRFRLPGNSDWILGPGDMLFLMWRWDGATTYGWYVHGIPGATATPSAVASAGSVGTSNRWAREDHTHAHEAAHIQHDTTWAARGDLIVATGNDAAGRHPIGTHGQVLKVDTNETASVTWGTVAAVETQTAISGIQNSETTYTSGTVKLSELANITIRSTTGQAFQFSVAAPGGTALSAGVSTGGNTEGNTTVNTGSRLVLVGSNMVSLSQATGAGASTITIKATQTNQSAIKGLGVSNTGNTAGNTGLSSGIDWVIAASGNLTASESTAVGGPNTVWLSVAPGGGAETQTAISGIANSETTYTSGTVRFSALGNATLRSTTGQAFEISVPSQTAITATTVSSVSNANAVGANNSRFALEAHIHEGVRRFGVSNIGNSSGSTTVVPGSAAVLAGGNNITLSQSSDAASNITITISGAAAGAAGPAQSYWGNWSMDISTATHQTLGLSTSYIFPLFVPYDISFGYLRIPVSAGVSTSATIATTANGTGSGSHVMTHNYVLFTRGTGASSMSLMSAHSTSAGLTQQWSFSESTSTQWTVSYRISLPGSSGTTSFSTSIASSLSTINFVTSVWSNFESAGVMRFWDVPWSSSLAAGEYWLGSGVSTSSGTGGSGGAAYTQNRLKPFSTYVGPQLNSSIAEFGVATNSSYMLQQGLGSYSIAAGATTAELAHSRVSSSASHPVPFVQFRRTA